MAATLTSANRVNSANMAGLWVDSVCRCSSQQTTTSAQVLPLLILILLMISSAIGCIGHTQKESETAAFGAKDYIKQAQKYYDEDKLEKAMECIQKAIELGPKSTKAYWIRGKIREAMDDPDFEDDFNYAIDLEDAKD